MDTQSSLKNLFQDLPEGTVTFLFTDIEGSTQLLHHLRESYATLLADQRRILREAIDAWHGHEVDTQGDAFFVAFSRATQAVSAAAEAQRKLADHAWPEQVAVRVRMGVHTGEPWSGQEGYVGMDVHRAARIAHVGHGGQVLLSETTTALVQDELPPGVSLFDLGRHLLKDIHRPEHICQLVIEGMPAKFPPLTSLEALPAEGVRLPRQVGKCPYRGLSAFQEMDAPFYFGRETFIDSLEQAIGVKKLVAVIVGSSGSGKSSALFAGLLPRLRKEGGYQFVTFRPGSQPFYSLADALLPQLESGLSETDRLAETRNLAEHLTKGEVTLSQVTGRIHKKIPGIQHILLVVDQFEELYTLCPDARLRKAFIDELLAAVETNPGNRDGTVVILLTLRADFMGQALAYRPFADALQAGSLLMGPMTRQELYMAIEKPAGMQGAAFEPGLVERILDDVGDNPGNLPLLEFTLTQLWDLQTDGWLTHTNYETMGCVEGALATYADQVYAKLETDEKELARRALVQLVRPGEATEDTRRIATREELGDESWRLIQHLADRRLVVTGRDSTGHETAEVVHEALIQKWNRFQEWMDADRAFRAWQERLRASLRQWQESGQDDGALLAGAPLLVAETWLVEREGSVILPEAQYIRASLALQERQQKERQHRRQWTVFGLTAGLIIAISLSVFAFYQRQNALRGTAVMLAGQAETELANGYHDRAVLLALAALEDFPYTWQAEHALGQAVSYSRAIQQYTNHQSTVTSVAWSPDGKRVASSCSVDNEVHIWDPVTGKTILVINMPKGITGNFYDMALNVLWTLDGKRLLTITGDRYTLGSQDYDMQVWDATSGEMLSNVEIANQTEPEAGDLNVYGSFNFPIGAAAEIAPRSERLATLGGDNTALIWDPAWEKPTLVLSGHTNDVNSVDWSPDETKLVTASLDGTVKIWDAQSGKALQTLISHEGKVYIAIWSPDGSQIASAGTDGVLRIWNAADGALDQSIKTNGEDVFSLAWAPNGVRLISGHHDGNLRIWDVTSGQLLETLRGHQGIITDLKWSSVDNRLASGEGNGYARIWNAAPSTAWRLYPPQAERGGDWTVLGASWSNDGVFLAVAGGDYADPAEPPSFAIWDVAANRLTKENMVEKLNLNGQWAFFSPDSQAILYTGVGTGTDMSTVPLPLVTAYVFDANSGEIIHSFTPGGDEFIRSVAWSPDSSQIATSLFGSKIVIWDYQTGEKITDQLRCGEGYFSAYMEWSPDGEKFAAACDDSVALVWDAHTWELLFTLHHDPPAYLNVAAWSPDGKYLLTGGGNDERGAKDTSARIWDGETGKELLAFRNHTKTVLCGSWSPNGRRVATGSADGTVRIWDSKTGAELLTLIKDEAFCICGWWSPDGKHLAVTGYETLISVWNVWQSTDELIAYAKENYVFRQLTPVERQQFGLK
jgi:WD40 repeat protein/class 3 adenylate cyclase